MEQFKFKNRNGFTPLNDIELKGIKFSHLTNMGELDQLEDANIQKGLDWLNNYKNDDYLCISFLNKLHKKMFGDVWKWAGSFRTYEVNIKSSLPFKIETDLIEFFLDVKVWIEHASIPWGELEAEFHHRLVSIHPYPNGNGRISRIMTEYLQQRNGQKVTSWKSSLKKNPDLRREMYINSLKKADQLSFKELTEFITID
jgi:Fic-DOC domain mobile mystery protein B